MRLPEPVAVITNAYMELLAEALPGHLKALYLYGSVALDNYRHGSSDIDFVAVTSGEAAADPATETALREVHRQLVTRFPRPHFDGIYVTWDELANDPADTTGLYCCDGVFGHGSFERVPITWSTLAQCGITVYGPDISGVKLATDPHSLADWLHDNLDDYWRNWWSESSKPLSPKGIALLAPSTVMWGVLGVTRLHYTLETGKITSKGGAGDYARTVFAARWHRIIDEAMRIRDGNTGKSGYVNPFTRRADALEFMDMVIDDAHRADPAYRNRNAT